MSAYDYGISSSSKYNREKMTNFTVESWIWYGVVAFMVILRYVARILLFKSPLRLQVEDWLMLFIFALYTILIAFLNVDATVNTNLINPADIPHLTPQDIRQRTWGSKTVLLVEQCMCAVQWGTKICLLILYWRLTQNLAQNLAVKIAFGYVAVTYVVMEILYFAVWCRPFHDYWQTPTNNTQCTTALHHLIVNLAFNLSSDIFILSIPLPLLLKARLEWKRKVLLVFPFSLGFFTIICAILSKHLSFTRPFSAEWVNWYCRESSTAMIVTNMPYSWSLIRRIFNLKSFFGDSDDSHKANGQQGSHVTLQGLSVPGAGGSSAGMQSSKKHSLLSPSRWKGTMTSSKLSSSKHASDNYASDVPGQQAFLDAPLSVTEKSQDVRHANPSSSSSMNSIIKVPPPVATSQSSAAAAVDKMYRLDDIDDDFDEPESASRPGSITAENSQNVRHANPSSPSSIDSELQVPPPVATSQSSAAAAVDKLYRLDDIDDDVEESEIASRPRPAGSSKAERLLSRTT